MKKLILIITLFFSLNAMAQTPQLFMNIHPGAGQQEGVMNLAFGTVNGNSLYFNVRDSATGQCTIYVTDGTVAGTKLLKTISQIANFQVYNNEVYFGFVDTSNGGSQLWKTDGTVAGTILITTIGGIASAPNSFIVVNNLMYFSAGTTALPFNSRLYVSDGTAGGTQLLTTNLYHLNYTKGTINNKVLFSASTNIDSMLQRELYITDGTVAGTVLLKDINPGAPGSNPDGFTPMNGKVYFSANTAAEGSELWSTDGTTIGTKLVKDINTGSGSSFLYTPSFGVFNNQLYFGANSGSTGRELFVSDGTTLGTQLVKEILVGSTGSNPSSFVEVSGKLLFICNDSINGSEIWTTDGTANGTTLFMDINAGNNSGVYALNQRNRTCSTRLYFDGDDGNYNIEPWTTDGTVAGTHKLGEINPSGSSVDYETIYQKLNNKIYLSAREPVNGKEIYVMEDSCKPLSIKNILPQVEFSIFPNPTQNQLTINTSDNHSKAEISIRTMLGQEVKRINMPQQTNQLAISVEGFTPGLYTITITTEKAKSTKQFLIN